VKWALGFGRGGIYDSIFIRATALHSERTSAGSCVVVTTSTRARRGGDRKFVRYHRGLNHLSPLSPPRRRRQQTLPYKNMESPQLTHPTHAHNQKVVTVVTVVTTLNSRGFFCHHLAPEVVTGGDILHKVVQVGSAPVFSICRGD